MSASVRRLALLAAIPAAIAAGCGSSGKTTTKTTQKSAPARYTIQYHAGEHCRSNQSIVYASRGVGEGHGGKVFVVANSYVSGPGDPAVERVVVASGPDGDPSNAIPFAYNIVMARPDTCEKRKSACQRIGRVFNEALAYLHAHPQETIAILQKRFAALEPALIASAFEEIRKSTPAPRW